MSSAPPKMLTNILPIESNPASSEQILPDADEGPVNAIERLMQNAFAGDSDAQFELAAKYRSGTLVSKDLVAAFKWLQRAVKKGHKLAQNDLGVAYEQGWGTKKDIKQACEWFQRAADQGYPAAQWNLGIYYFNGKECIKQDLPLGLHWLHKAAEGGDAKAQNKLGVAYKKGIGVKKDLKASFEWYRKAAHNGFRGAQYTLGILLRKGSGISKDLEASLEWFTRAAEEGHVQAQVELGEIFSRGKNVEIDTKAAFKWYLKAAEKEHTDAEYMVGELYDFGNGVEKNETEAVLWYMRAAKKGHAQAQYNLGCSYKDGQGVEQNKKIAMEWFKSSAKQGFVDANLMIGEMYLSGEGVNRDEKTAKEYLLKAAMHGCVDGGGESPLFWVSRFALPEFIPALIEKRNNQLNKQFGQQKLTPLLMAFDRKKTNCVKTLLMYHADPKICSTVSSSLHYALDLKLTFIPLLIWKGADLRALNNKKQTPLVLAESRQRHDHAKLLRIIEVVKPIFCPEHMQLLADLVYKFYLEKYPKDDLLKENRRFLQEIIKRLVEHVNQGIFNKYKNNLIKAQGILDPKKEIKETRELEVFLKNLLIQYLEDFFLDEKQPETFWQPYIEWVAKKEKDPEMIRFLEKSLPDEVTDIIQQYLGIVSPVLGFVEDARSQFSDEVASNQAIILRDMRITKAEGYWLQYNAHTQQVSKDLIHDKGDTKESLRRELTAKSKA